jgi:hypothetical protein
MLLHLSFTARDVDRVASVLAELLGATVVTCPSPPFPAGSRYVCCFDEHGTMVEVLPAGTTYQRVHGASPRAVTGEPVEGAASGVHGLFSTPLSLDQISAIAGREGWPCGLVDTGRFKVLAVWLESTQLIELTTPELLPDYVALYGARGRDTLDPFLREVETHLRRVMAAGPEPRP